MNEFLKNREQITRATAWLQENGYTTHPISCKDWELKLITEAVQDGNLCDLGADGSFVLHNAVKKGLYGRKVGIDLAEVTGSNKAEGVEYFQGDLMHTPFEDESFNTIVCMSVLEHQINYDLFAKEVSRLLGQRGVLYVSFDYAPEKIDTSLTKLYSLDWNILSTEDVHRLIIVCAENNLQVAGQTDWGVQDMVINPQYCSPAQGVSYTFGIFKFVKFVS